MNQSLSRSRALFVSGFALSGLLWFGLPSRAAPESVSTPKPGSALRSAILNALRVPVSAAEKKRVTFTQVQIRASRSYAFVEAAPVDARGKSVGQNMPLQAFLRKSGSKWRVLEWIYAGDVISLEWEKKYRAAPKKIWPHFYY